MENKSNKQGFMADANNSQNLSIYLILFLCTVGLYLLFKNSLNSKLKSIKSLRKLPGPPQTLVFGNALDFKGSHENILLTLIRWCNNYGPRLIFRVGWYWTLIISSPEDVEKILSSPVEMEKSPDYERLVQWLGRGLLTSKGQKWHLRRKLLTPAFHFKILEQFVDVINEQSKILIHIFRDELADGKVFDVYPYINRCTLDIICETAMGRSINAQKEHDSEYLKATYRIAQLIEYRSFHPYLHPNFIWKLSPFGWEERKCLKILHGFSSQVIKERKSEYLLKCSEREKIDSNNVLENNDIFMTKRKRLAFLDLLLEAQKNGKNELSDIDIREEADTFMFEGHDTTAASISFAIFLLGCHQNEQKNVKEELNNIFGDDTERQVTMQDMPKMKYLECCIKETLRLFPSVPFFLRKLTSDFQLDGDTIIPKGTVPLIFPYQLHRDPKHFPNPQKFNPERFLQANSIGRHPFAYVPFSAGPRNCIGQKFAMMEQKIVLSYIFRHFTIVAAENMEDLVLIPDLIIRSKNGMKIKICTNFIE